MSWLGSFGGDMLGHYIGGAIDTQNSKHLQEHSARMQLQNWKEMQSSQYQLMREDLQKANLNPILAISGGVSSVSSPSAPSGGGLSSKSTAGSSATASEVAKKQVNVAETNAETEQKRVDNQGRLIESQAKNLEALTRKLEQLLPYDTAEAQSRIDRNYGELAQGWSRIEVSMRDVDSLIKLREKQGRLSDAQAGQCVALIGKIVAETTGQHINNGLLFRELTNPDVNIHRDYRNSAFGKYAGYANEVLGDLGNVASIAGKILGGRGKGIPSTAQDVDVYGRRPEYKYERYGKIFK